MQHRGLIALPIFALALAACTDTPATTETTATTGDTATGTATGTGTATEPATEGQATDEPTTDTPTTQNPSDPTGDPTGNTTVDPSATDTTATDTAGDEATIYDVQMGKFAAKDVVTIKGVIVTSPVKLKDGKGTMFVEEPEGGEYSGIAVYMYDEVTAALDAPPGSVVDLTATYDEFYGNSQLVVMAVGDITVTGTAEIPARAVVQSADIATGGAKAENYEGVLVEIDDAKVTDPAIDIGQFEVEGGARVSDYFLFDLGMSPKPKLGDVYPSVVGPLLYSFDQFQIAPRSLEDLGGEPQDTTSGTTGDTTTGDMMGDTIYDIQMGKFKVMDPVTVEGVIATSGLTFKKDGFFVQDPKGGEYSGIFVYIGANMVTVAPGDVLTINGTYDEFFTYSELKVAKAADIKKTGTAPVPAPAVVTSAEVATGGAKAENYEGVLVHVKNAKVTTAIDMNAEFIVDMKLRVDDLFFAKADWVNPKVNDIYTSITGPLAYTFDNFKVAPRTIADLVK
jgi:predicted extracellular nuclease